VTVTTDLLIGIAAGVALKLMLSLWYVGLAHRLNGANGTNGAHSAGLGSRFLNLFRNPIGLRQFCEGNYDLYVERPLVCFNLFHVIRELQEIPEGTTVLRLHITPLVPLVDHTTAETLFHYVREFDSRELKMELVNWEQLRPLSDHPSAIQLGLSGELIEAMHPGTAIHQSG
jgi:hypothetical protein